MKILLSPSRLAALALASCVLTVSCSDELVVEPDATSPREDMAVDMGDGGEDADGEDTGDQDTGDQDTGDQDTSDGGGDPPPPGNLCEAAEDLGELAAGTRTVSGRTDAQGGDARDPVCAPGVAVKEAVYTFMVPEPAAQLTMFFSEGTSPSYTLELLEACAGGGGGRGDHLLAGRRAASGRGSGEAVQRGGRDAVRAVDRADVGGVGRFQPTDRCRPLRLLAAAEWDVHGGRRGAVV